MRRLLCIAGFTLWFIHALTQYTAGASLDINCYQDRVQLESYQFNAYWHGEGAMLMKFRGYCNVTIAGSSIAYPPEMAYSVEAVWLPRTSEAKELIKVYWDGGETSGQVICDCPDNPWLRDVKCTSPGILVPGAIYEVLGMSSLNTEEPYETSPGRGKYWVRYWTKFPLTFAGIPPVKKLALNLEIKNQPPYIDNPKTQSVLSAGNIQFQGGVRLPLPVKFSDFPSWEIEVEHKESCWPTPGQPSPVTIKTRVPIDDNTGLASKTIPLGNCQACCGDYELRARTVSPNHTGHWTEWVRFKAASPGSTPPTNLKAEFTGVTMCMHIDVKLTWQAYALGQKGFAIERKLFLPISSKTYDFVRIATVAGDKREYIDRSNTIGGEYSYRVKTLFEGFESGYSNETKMLLELAPAAPRNLICVSGSQVGVNAPIKLSWTDYSADEEGFVIERRDPGSNQFKRIGGAGPNVQEFTDSGKPAGTYAYQVKAFFKGCSSFYSNTISVQVGTPFSPQPPPKPSAPKGMREIK